MTTAPTFGQTLTKALKTRGLTQIAFARKLRASPASVNAWVRDHEEPRISTLREIATVLETTPSALLEGRWRARRTKAA